MLDCNNDRAKHFTLKLGVAIYGGFAGIETARADRDWETNETVLSADLGENDLWDSDTSTWSNREENAWHVFLVSNDFDLDPTTILDGFTVKNGHADTEPYDTGGGAIRLGATNAPAIRNCIFSGNYSSLFGGAISVEESTGTIIEDCAFIGNFSRSGGAIAVRDGGITVIDSLFDGNYTAAPDSNQRGGAISFTGTIAAVSTITGSTFTGNTSPNAAAFLVPQNILLTVSGSTFSLNSDGSGTGTIVDIHTGGELIMDTSTFSGNNGTPILNGGSLEISDTLFSDNTSANTGGIRNNSGSTALITGCRFVANSSDQFGGAMNNEEGIVTVINSVFDGNSAVYGGAI
jgi:predicted outer membrane repeat protein